MIKYLRKTSSLSNLKGNVQGQIATLLIFMMTVIIIFILATVNLGQVSLTATNLSNSTDSASLNLASQLATKSHLLYTALGNTTKKCVKGGLLSSLLSVFAAIVAIIAAPFTAGTSLGWYVAVGAAGGAIGGLTGAAIMGQTSNKELWAGFLGGMQTGAMIGFGMGLGATTAPAGTQATVTASTSSATAPTAGIGGVTSATTVSGTLQTAATVGNTATVMTSVGPVTGTLTSITASSPVLGATLTGLNALGNIYNSSVNERNDSATKAASTKQLNGLPENDRYREGAFLQVLSQVVDDPNTVRDVDDINGNGDVDEKIPYFSQWWYMRTNKIKEIVPRLRNLTSGFIDGPLTTFRDYANNPYTEGCDTYDAEGHLIQVCNPKFLSRAEVEGEDGVLVKLLRALESGGYNISFWQPGTEANDELDSDVSELQDVVVVADGIRGQGREQLTSTWQSWVKVFYDEETNGDYYEILGNMLYGNVDQDIKGLNAWKSEIITIRNSLADCKYEGNEGNTYISNAPCKNYSDGQTFATIDGKGDDFAPSLAAIDEFKTKIENFRPAIQQYYSDMQREYATIGTSYGGLNPVTYTWKTKSTQGNTPGHQVIVEVGPFQIPEIRYTESGNWLKKKKCQVLENYSDDGSRTYVRVTRREQVNKSMGVAGKWNPYDNDDPLDPTDSSSDGWFSVSKISRAYYSYNNVGIAGKK